MGFLLSMDLFLGEQAFATKKVFKKWLFFYVLFRIIEDLPLYGVLCFLELSFWDLNCCNPPQEKDGGKGKKGW